MDPVLYSIQSCLATAYSHHGQLQLAKELFDRVLVAQKDEHKSGHPNIGLTYHHMGSNLWRMDDLTGAMECYRASLKILLECFEHDHFEVTTVQNKMRHLDETMKQRKN